MESIKMDASYLFIFLALFAGSLIPFQSAMNAALGKNLQSPYFSALTVFIVAAIGLALYILVARYQTPAAEQFVSAPAWSYLGGMLGGTYILLIVICIPKLGVGAATVMILLGQIFAAMIIDQFGLLGAARHAVNWPRLLGLALMIAGVYLVKKF